MGAKEPFPIIGTMSDLHEGLDAPNMAASGEALGLPSTWRLLGRDTRDTDGVIPEEDAVLSRCLHSERNAQISRMIRRESRCALNHELPGRGSAALAPRAHARHEHPVQLIASASTPKCRRTAG